MPSCRPRLGSPKLTMYHDVDHVRVRRPRPDKLEHAQTGMFRSKHVYQNRRIIAFNLCADDGFASSLVGVTWAALFQTCLCGQRGIRSDINYINLFSSTLFSLRRCMLAVGPRPSRRLFSTGCEMRSDVMWPTDMISGDY